MQPQKPTITFEDAQLAGNMYLDSMYNRHLDTSSKMDNTDESDPNLICG